MRIDLCRRCGAEMEVSKRCSVCHGANEFLCRGCGVTCPEQTHLSCMLISLDCAMLDARAA